MGWLEDAAMRDPYVQATSSIPVPRSGGGMDPILGSAIIGGVSSVGSAVTGGKAAKEAAKAQSASQDKALAFAREQEQTRQNQYNQAFKLWHASQNALRERYGLPPLPAMESFPSSGAQSSGFASPRMAGVNPMGVQARPGSVQPATIGEIIGAKGAPPDLESWSDWKAQRLG